MLGFLEVQRLEFAAMSVTVAVIKNASRVEQLSWRTVNGEASVLHHVERAEL